MPKNSREESLRRGDDARRFVASLRAELGLQIELLIQRKAEERRLGYSDAVKLRNLIKKNSSGFTQFEPTGIAAT